jgi:hypothetical protein
MKLWFAITGLLVACRAAPHPQPTPQPQAQANQGPPAPASVTPAASPTELLDLTGAWGAQQYGPIVDKTLHVRLAPDLSHLTAGERAAVGKLRELGELFQALYEDQRHRQAAAARAALASHGGPDADALRQLYRLFQGPIATTLDNQREAFLPVDPVQPGKTVYPWGITKAELDAYLAAHPAARDELLAVRTVVRRATPDALAADLAALDRHPVLDTLHVGLRTRLSELQRAPAGFYAVPYAVAYADATVRAHALLHEAAEAVAPDDAQFAGYLANRARDLLANDYESGDAAWVTADFKNLNAQIGAYETYDDELYGSKAFYSLSVLARRPQDSQALVTALAGLQSFEDALPYSAHKRVRERIPVGVYDVIADYGQARGGNTASILPNEAYLTKRYGRTILLRGNVMRDPKLFAERDRVWEAAMAPAHHAEPTPDGPFYRTLWHEVGHYLGVDTTHDGRDLDLALEDAVSVLEEMKADLVSLFVARSLHRKRYYTDAQLRSVYASGIHRVLLNNRPRRDQPYQTMQLIQWNFFLEKKLLRFDAAAKTLSIDHRRYHETVAALLGQVLALQRAGDKAAVERFIERHTRWDDALHGVVAQRIRDQQRYRFTLFEYAD